MKYTHEEIEKMLEGISSWPWRQKLWNVIDCEGLILTGGHSSNLANNNNFIAASPSIVRQLLDKVKEQKQRADYYKAADAYIRADWEKQNEQIKILKEALGYYAKKINHSIGSVMADSGDKAREALAKVEGK